MHLDLKSQKCEQAVEVELPRCGRMLAAVSKFRTQLSLMLFRISLKPLFKLGTNVRNIGASASV
jgi:hypothetical protein